MRINIILDLPKEWKVEDTELSRLTLCNNERMAETDYDHFGVIIRAMPMKKMSENVIYVDDEPYLVEHHMTEYDRGWNDCIDYILGRVDNE